MVSLVRGGVAGVVSEDVFSSLLPPRSVVEEEVVVVLPTADSVSFAEQVERPMRRAVVACIMKWRITHHGVTVVSQTVFGVSGRMERRFVAARRQARVIRARKLARVLRSPAFWSGTGVWERQGRQRVMRAL